MQNIGEQINFNNLIYYFKGKNISPINFIGFKGLMHIYNNIKNDNTSIEKMKKDQKQFKSKLNEITTVNPKHKSKDQLNTIKNIINFYSSREKVIKLHNDYNKIKSEALPKQNREQYLKY